MRTATKTGGPRRGAGRLPRGVSLIEVLIATLVLATASLVAFPTLLSFFDLSSAAREENIATHDLRAAAEDVMSTPFLQVPVIFPNGQAIPKYTSLHLANQQIVVSYTNPAATPLEVTLTGTWLDHRGRPRQEQVLFLRSD